MLFAAIAAAIVLLAPAPRQTGSVLEIVGRPGPVGTPAPVAATPGLPAPAAADTDLERQAIRQVAHRAPAVTGPPPPERLTGYRWPIGRPRITLPFGPTPWGTRVVDGRPFHDGIDLATFCGDRIKAAHDGIVIAAGRHYDKAIGWIGDLSAYYRRLDRKRLWRALPIVVVIDDGNQYRSVYAHFSRIEVRKGDVVEAGDLLGYEGMTGHASGCHLHYGLFSPRETETFRIKADVAQRMKLPRLEIARVDPLLVLPENYPVRR